MSPSPHAVRIPLLLTGLIVLLAVGLALSAAPAVADGQPPVTTHDLLGLGGRTSNGWFTGPVEVHLDATDAGGDAILRTEYRVDGGPWEVQASSQEVIFDGTQASFDRWRMAGPGEFVLGPDGTMTTTGGMGMLWYPVRAYGDMLLELEWRDAKPEQFGASNAGVFIRFPDVDEAVARTPEDRWACQGGSSESNPVWVAVHCGQEVQIYDGAAGDPQKTGSIYNFASLGLDRALPAPQGDWTSYAIQVQGDGDYEVAVSRDGREINRWRNTPGQIAPREGDPGTSERQFAEGYIGLQNHGYSDYIQFRNIRVTDLSAAEPILVQGDGEHIVEYRSTDGAGNVEPIRSVVLRIDANGPVGQASAAPILGGTRVTFSADDLAIGSGVRWVEHRVDGGEWQPQELDDVLFDGTQASLDRWTMSGPGAFELSDDDSMRTSGGLGLLWWPEREYDDVAYTLEWREAREDGEHSNGGVFIRFPHPEDAVAYPTPDLHACQVGLGLFLAEWSAINCGHEIQINDGSTDPQQTGSVYNFRSLNAEQARPNTFGDWNRYEIRTVGGGSYDVTVVRNGEIINTFRNSPGQLPARAFDPPTDLRQFAQGYMGLQNHGTADAIEYRDVRALPLTPRTVAVDVASQAQLVEVRARDAAGNVGPAVVIDLG